VGVGRAVVGRDLDAEVWLDSGKVSRRHAVIEVTPQGVWVEDLDSANGTRVNGIAVSGKVAVGDGDEVTFGNTTMRLQFLRSDGVAR
jgi:pSer/pThr/pTyr-binding forkhead associated (FHA) protein